MFSLNGGEEPERLLEELRVRSDGFLDALHGLGIHAEHTDFGVVQMGEGPVLGMVVAGHVSEAAFSDRVQWPERHGIAGELERMDQASDKFLDLRGELIRRMRDGQDPLSDD